MGTRPRHSFAIKTCGHMANKLHRELDRLCQLASDPDNPSDHAINFALTAWHMTEWVWRMHFDGDKEIQDALARSGSHCHGFLVPRLVYYLGKWWWRGGWYPDYDIRVFRRERATWGGSDPHEQIFVNGKVRRLRHPLHHYSYRDITDHIKRINHFTTVSSGELKGLGKRWRWTDSLCRPAARFFYSYVWKRGFLEGFPGFFVAVTAAVYVFLRYAKLRELELKDQKEGGCR